MAGVGPGGALLVAPDDCESALHSNIYVYLVNKGLTDVANALKNNGNISFDEDIIAKANARRTAGDDNEGDSKDDSIRLRAQGNHTGAIDLLQWWTLFWDMHSAGQRRDGGGLAGQYLAQAARLRQSQQNVPNAAMMGNAMMNTYGRMLPNQMNIAKTAMANNTRMNGLPQNMRAAQPGNPGPMQKDGNDTDMAGQARESSPSGDGAAPSPKRQRMDGPGMQQQAGTNGGMPMVNGQMQTNGAAPNASMLTASFDPNAMSPATNFKPGVGTPQQRQYSQTLVNQSRANLERLAQSNAAGMGTGSPMMTGADGQFISADMFPGGQPNPAMRGQMPANMPQNPSNQGGALADYQMQLMLLEQQNKRRLMMARQEQDVAGNQIIPPGLAPGMSPRQNSRTGQSPPDPSKRGTPKLGQDANLPEGVRGSPIPGIMDPNQLPPGMGQQFFPSMNAAANGGMMRPGIPAGQMAATQIELMRRNQQMNGQFVQGQMGGPMMQNQMMQGQPDQRQSMPPPQAPPAPNAGRNGSPQQTPAPPTPSQANKAAPKGKKEPKETKKKPPKKAVATTAATPTAEGEASDDVPPPTPSTPKNTASHLIKGTAPQLSNVQPQPQMPAQNNVPNMAMAQNNNAMMAPFSGMADNMDLGMNNFGENGMMDANGFGDGLDLQGFDFDSFLDVPDDGNALFGPGLDFSTSLDAGMPDLS